MVPNGKMTSFGPPAAIPVDTLDIDSPFSVVMVTVSSLPSSGTSDTVWSPLGASVVVVVVAAVVLVVGVAVVVVVGPPPFVVVVVDADDVVVVGEAVVVVVGEAVELVVVVGMTIELVVVVDPPVVVVVDPPVVVVVVTIEQSEVHSADPDGPSSQASSKSSPLVLCVTKSPQKVSVQGPSP